MAQGIAPSRSLAEILRFGRVRPTSGIGLVVCTSAKTSDERTKRMADEKKKCFVISPIGKEQSAERYHANIVLEYIVKPALPDIQVVRSDEFESSEEITPRIISAITSFDLAIADLSFANANVFYELGLRHMVRKPVIHICNHETNLPFDNAGVNTIVFNLMDTKSHENARQRISNFSKTMMASGYVVSNPVTSALGALKLQQSSDSSEQLMAQLLERVGSIEKFVHDYKETVRRISVPSAVISSPPQNALYDIALRLGKDAEPLPELWNTILGGTQKGGEAAMANPRKMK